MAATIGRAGSSAEPGQTGGNAGPGRRAQNKERTRLAIQQAAVELFEERGYAATRVEDIVARAGVSQRTFFRYFPSKELTLFGADRTEQVVNLILAAPGALGPVAALRWSMHQILSIETSALDRRRQAVRREVGDEVDVARHLTHLQEHLRLRLRTAFARRLGLDPADGEDPRPDVLLALHFGVGRAIQEVPASHHAVIDRWFDALGDVLARPEGLEPPTF